jgi:hypothetical protein
MGKPRGVMDMLKLKKVGYGLFALISFIVSFLYMIKGESLFGYVLLTLAFIVEVKIGLLELKEGCL